MALITCKKCGKSVSDQAEKCPHCGYDFKANATTLTIIYSKNKNIFISNTVIAFGVNEEIVKFSTANDFCTTITLNSTTTKIAGKTFEAKENEKYTCKIYYNPYLMLPLMPPFTVTDSNGNVVVERKKTIKYLLLFIALLLVFFKLWDLLWS